MNALQHQLLVLCLALCCACGNAALASDTDMRRAMNRVPRDAFRGHGRAETNRVLSQALRRAAAAVGGSTKPCEHFSVEQLIDVKRVLFAASDPALQRTYVAASDARRLATFGTEASNVDELERIWAEEVALLAGAPHHVHAAARDAKCYEAAMWFAHHVPAAAQADVALAVALPELPLARTSLPAVGANHSAAGHANTTARVRDAVAKASGGCSNAHYFPSSDPTPAPAPGSTPPFPVHFTADTRTCNGATGNPVTWQQNDCGLWSECDNPRGKLYYDFEHQPPSVRLDMENSACHQFMGNAAPGHDVLPKNQYTGPGTVVDAFMDDGASAKFVYWPELKKCCVCCKDKHGCGAIHPDFAAHNNATLKGREPQPNDAEQRDADVWFIPGMVSNNWVYTDHATGMPIGFVVNGTILSPAAKALSKILEAVLGVDIGKIVQGRTFHNVSTAPVNQSVFALPDYCSTSSSAFNTCGGEYCPYLRTIGSP